MDELEDRELAAALRSRADALTEDVVDTDAAFEVVRRRARTQRRWRSAAGGVLAAAAAAVAVLIVGSVAGDEAVVRTPATAPAVETTTAPTSTTAPTTTVPTTPVPTTLVPGTTLAPTTAPAPAVPEPSVAPPPEPPTSTMATPTSAAPTVATTAAPTTRTYDGNGGSITVRLAGGVISLAGDPVPAPGFSVRIDDNGPDRVRVRFELGDQRSEIRVDLEDGELVPEIIES